MYIGTHVSKLDGKHRVSMPKAFRVVSQDEKSFLLFKSNNFAGLIGGHTQLMRDHILETVGYEQLEQILPGALSLNLDENGRIHFPKDLLGRHFPTASHLSFLGRGPFFQLVKLDDAGSITAQARRAIDEAFTL